MTQALLALSLLFVVTAAAPTFNFFLPIRPTWLLFVLPTIIWWPIVVIVGVTGSVLGALPLYWVTEKATNQALVQRWLHYRWVQWILRHFSRQPFLLLLILTLTPIPDQLIGILGALEKYPLKKYVLANAIGRTIFYTPIVLGGYYFRGDINRLGATISQLLGF